MCVTKIHHVIILHMLKIYLSKGRENLNLSQGNQGKVRKFLHQTWLATLKVLCYLKFNAKYV